jgi:hypothetical protein
MDTTRSECTWLPCYITLENSASKRFSYCLATNIVVIYPYVVYVVVQEMEALFILLSRVLSCLVLSCLVLPCLVCSFMVVFDVALFRDNDWDGTVYLLLENRIISSGKDEKDSCQEDKASRKERNGVIGNTIIVVLLLLLLFHGKESTLLLLLIEHHGIDFHLTLFHLYYFVVIIIIVVIFCFFMTQFCMKKRKKGR